MWEEVTIGAPADTKFVCLSATVSNVAVFGRWLSQERGDVEVVVSKDRPVPLVHSHAVVDSTSADPISVFPSVDRRRFRRIDSTRRVGEWYGGYDNDFSYGEVLQPRVRVGGRRVPRTVQRVRHAGRGLHPQHPYRRRPATPNRRHRGRSTGPHSPGRRRRL